MMVIRFVHKDWFWFVFGGLFFLVDQFFKFLFFLRSPVVDWGFVRFHLALNTGSSFGLLQDGNLLLVWLSLIVLGSLLLFFDRLDVWELRLAIIASFGVLSNLFDRLFRGAVVDYIDLGLGVFNIADCLIVVGALLFAFVSWRRP